MIIETVMLVGGFVVTAAVGGPLAAFMGRSHQWRGTMPIQERDGRPDDFTATPFEPLDLGPDLMRWPSEVTRKATAIPEPQWPSQGWDDEHFGTHWRQQQYQGNDDTAVEARRQATAKARADEENAAQRRRANAEKEQRAQQSASQGQGMKERASDAIRQRKEALEDAKQRAQQEAMRQAQRAKQQVTQRATKAVQQAVPGLPSPTELEAMVGSKGLAGTVQEIMSRTGWDFRKAAHYLAKARQGG